MKLDGDASAPKPAPRGVAFGFEPPEQIGDVVAALAEPVMPAVADGRIRAVFDAVFPSRRGE
jgi:hypothetical protein